MGGSRLLERGFAWYWLLAIWSDAMLALKFPLTMVVEKNANPRQFYTRRVENFRCSAFV